MADNDNCLPNGSNSEDSENELYFNSLVPELKGYLSKWTNYIHGWQPRFIVLKDGTLSYYKRWATAGFMIVWLDHCCVTHMSHCVRPIDNKCPNINSIRVVSFVVVVCSEFESDYGCRGAISLDKATVKVWIINQSNALTTEMCFIQILIWICLHFNHHCRATNSTNAASMWPLIIVCGICVPNMPRIAPIGSKYCNRIKRRWKRHAPKFCRRHWIATAAHNHCSPTHYRRPARTALCYHIGVCVKNCMKSIRLETFYSVKLTHYKGRWPSTIRIPSNYAAAISYSFRFRYFDACADVHDKDVTPIDLGDGLNPIDFKVNWRSILIARITKCHILTANFSFMIDAISRHTESGMNRANR